MRSRDTFLSPVGLDASLRNLSNRPVGLTWLDSASHCRFSTAAGISINRLIWIKVKAVKVKCHWARCISTTQNHLLYHTRILIDQELRLLFTNRRSGADRTSDIGGNSRSNGERSQVGHDSLFLNSIVRPKFSSGSLELPRPTEDLLRSIEILWRIPRYATV